MDLGSLKDYVSLAGTFILCGITIGVFKQDMKDVKRRLEKNEGAVENLEKTYNVLTELSTDIKWMKKSLENLEKK